MCERMGIVLFDCTFQPYRKAQSIMTELNSAHLVLVLLQPVPHGVQGDVSGRLVGKTCPGRAQRH